MMAPHGERVLAPESSSTRSPAAAPGVGLLGTFETWSGSRSGADLPPVKRTMVLPAILLRQYPISNRRGRHSPSDARKCTWYCARRTQVTERPLHLLLPFYHDMGLVGFLSCPSKPVVDGLPCADEFPAPLSWRPSFCKAHPLLLSRLGYDLWPGERRMPNWTPRPSTGGWPDIGGDVIRLICPVRPTFDSPFAKSFRWRSYRLKPRSVSALAPRSRIEVDRVDLGRFARSRATRGRAQCRELVLCGERLPATRSEIRDGGWNRLGSAKWPHRVRGPSVMMSISVVRETARVLSSGRLADTDLSIHRSLVRAGSYARSFVATVERVRRGIV